MTVSSLRIRWLAVLTVLAIAVVLSACSNSPASAPTPQPTPTPTATLMPTATPTPQPTPTAAPVPTATPMPQPTPIPTTTPVPTATPLPPPPDSLGLDPFYKKYLDADKLPIVSSGEVPNAALFRARDIIDEMLVNRPDLRATIAEMGVRVAIMAESEVTTDIPEHSDLYEAFPSTDWNARARGLSATRVRPATSAAAARDPLPRLLVVDEVWSIMQHPEGAAFMVNMAKRARKHRLGLQFITQDVQDLLSEDSSRTITGHSGRALLQNAAFKLLQQQDAAAISTVGDAFDLPPELQRWLLSCPRGDGLLLARGNRFPIRIEATPEEQALIEWSPGRHD